MYQHLLVPIDDSDLSMPLVGQALALARRLNARISFLHPLPEIARLREGLAKAEAAARALGLPCSRLSRRTDNAARSIMDVAAEQGCDLIVTTSPGDSATPTAVFGAETLQTLIQGDHPVLITTLREETAASTRTLNQILDRHRTLVTVLHAWQDLVANAQALPRQSDAVVMRLALRFLGGHLHWHSHPVESAQLFRLLRLRTSQLDAELDELERQHHRDGQMLHELAVVVEQVAAAGSREAFTLLKVQLERYCDFVWDHLGRKEGVVLPAARHWLRAEDWALLDTVCRSTPDADAGHPGLEQVLRALRN